MPDGTIILCDNVYQTVDGKFVISGTYDSVFMGVQDLAILRDQATMLQHAIHFYVRFPAERPGAVKGIVTLQDQGREVWGQAIMAMEMSFEITKVQSPMVQLGVGVNIHLPVGKMKWRYVGFGVEQIAIFSGELRLDVNNNPIGSSPFKIIIRHASRQPYDPDLSPGPADAPPEGKHNTDGST